ncbi:hypothetical protein R5R35_000311 [Gryllus longicercus]|uniref:Allatotropin n=1 Tax=Gryllus longicercus TaxID=2509291 RepID=A0AAN9W1Q6_9ORTH
MRRPCVSSMCAAAALLCLLACVAGGASAGYQGRSKPRTIRGFKNVALSTARGFGKRAGGGVAQGPGEAVPASALDLLAAAPPAAADAFAQHDSFPVEWFVEEMQSNPELARVIVHKFVDANQDGELSPEELLRPLY